MAYLIHNIYVGVGNIIQFVFYTARHIIYGGPSRGGGGDVIWLRMREFIYIGIYIEG